MVTKDYLNQETEKPFLSGQQHINIQEMLCLENGSSSFSWCLLAGCLCQVEAEWLLPRHWLHEVAEVDDEHKLSIRSQSQRSSY